MLVLFGLNETQSSSWFITEFWITMLSDRKVSQPSRLLAAFSEDDRENRSMSEMRISELLAIKLCHWSVSHFV